MLKNIKKNKYTFLPFIFFFSFCVSAYNQTVVRNIVTRQVEQKMLQSDTLVKANKKNIELFIKRNKPHGKISEKIIPVVFHNLYNNPSEMIDETNLLEQLNVLNNHFSGIVSEGFGTFSHLAEIEEGFSKLRSTQLKIQFCLAALETTTTGQTNINYVETVQEEWYTDDSMKKENTGSPSVQPDKFLNIWIVNLANDTSGYATMPWAKNEMDGIVIDYSFYGIGDNTEAPYNEGKTMTHLVGNYLGLYDLWSDHCMDDNVMDTPIHNAPNFGCPDYLHVTTCFDNIVEMSMNFMDNTNDACMNMFTKGQMLRMHTILGKDGPREGLVVEPNSTDCANASNLASATNRTQTEQATQIEVSNSIEIRPNPANAKITLEIRSNTEDNIKISIYSADGKSYLQEEHPTGQSIEINSSSWPPGIYFLKSMFTDQVITKQFIIAR